MTNQNEERLLLPKDKFAIHISYNEALTLKELTFVLEQINKAINDVNRDNGVKSNNTIGTKYAPAIVGVESGSIILHIIANFVLPITLNVLANAISKRLFEKKQEKTQKNADMDCHISINVTGNDNLIECKIIKPTQQDEE